MGIAVSKYCSGKVQWMGYSSNTTIDRTIADTRRVFQLGKILIWDLERFLILLSNIFENRRPPL